MGDLTLYIGLAAPILAMGVSAYLTEIAGARSTEAKARLLEAENCLAALNDRDQGEGGSDGA